MTVEQARLIGWMILGAINNAANRAELLDEWHTTLVIRHHFSGSLEDSLQKLEMWGTLERFIDDIREIEKKIEHA